MNKRIRWCGLLVILIEHDSSGFVERNWLYKERMTRPNSGDVGCGGAVIFTDCHVQAADARSAHISF